jgi:hypothetical protein
MGTTIQVHQGLLEQLERLKRSMNARSYEEVIVHLLQESKRLDVSYFGKLKKLKTFKREELDRLG